MSRDIRPRRDVMDGLAGQGRERVIGGLSLRCQPLIGSVLVWPNLGFA